ncbi:hypothetical protein BC829DRAFT_384719 [Chytridium lagenaria]|nr:hypothetical protein BC829DRAFT_384719 [Chytridium lagenaria]
MSISASMSFFSSSMRLVLLLLSSMGLGLEMGSEAGKGRWMWDAQSIAFWRGGLMISGMAVKLSWMGRISGIVG